MPVMLMTVLVLLPKFSMPPVAEPPVPDFKTRVDYVQWYKDQINFSEKDNAYAEYAKFMNLHPGQQLAIPEQAETQLKDLFASPKPWNSSEYPALAQWLKTIEPYLVAYTKGSKYTSCIKPVEGNPGTMVAVLLPGMASSQILTKAMFALAWQTEGKFDGAKFVDCLTTINRHANHLSQGPMLIEQLLALGIKESIYRRISQALEMDILSIDDLESLRSALQKEDATDFATILTCALQTELATTYDFLQMICTENGIIQPRISRSVLTSLSQAMTQPGGNALSEDDVSKVAQADPVILSKQTQEYYHSIIKLCARHFPENMEALYREKYDQLVAFSPFYTAFLTNLESTFTMCLNIEIKRRGTQVLLALVIYKKKEGHWPRDLFDPALKLKRDIRNDLRSGKNFAYQVDGDQMKLYSVGRDGQDSGGVSIGPKHDGSMVGEDYLVWPTPK